MSEHPAVNASPLIFLSRAGLLDMLKMEGDEIVILKNVAEEIRREGLTISPFKQSKQRPGLR